MLIIKTKTVSIIRIFSLIIICENKQYLAIPLIIKMTD